MDSGTTSAIRDIFIIVAAGTFSVLCLVLTVGMVKLFRPFKETISNSAKTTENTATLTGNLASVSEETANNLAQTSRNLVEISENLKEGSEGITDTVNTARQAASTVSQAAGTVATIAETVSRFTSLGVTGGGSSGVGTMLRMLRNMFQGNRRNEGGGSQQKPTV